MQRERAFGNDAKASTATPYGRAEKGWKTCRRSLWAGALAMFVLLLHAAPVCAQSATTAEELKRQGDEASDDKRYLEALQLYERAYAIGRAPALHYNRARALEFLHRFPEAEDELASFIAEAPSDLKARVPRLDELLQEYRAKVSSLKVTCNTPGARVLVDRKLLAETGAGPLLVRVNQDSVQLEIVADGYLPELRDLKLEGGRVHELTIVLKPRVEIARLRVKSSLSDVQGWVDGTPRGDVPFEIALTPGNHFVRLEKRGHESTGASVLLRANEQRDLALDPKHIALTSRWYFWAGIGSVLVAGALTAVVLATTEREPDQGSGFAPGRVRALTNFSFR